MSTQPSPVLDAASNSEYSVVTGALANYGFPVAVCSYHFRRVKHSRPYKTVRDGTYRTVYEWPKCSDIDGPPQMVVVRDGFFKSFQGTDELSRRKSYIDQPVSASAIAKDLANAVNSSLVSGPAFWVVKTSNFPAPSLLAKWNTPDFPRKFPEFVEECKAWRTRAFQYCETLIAQADSFHAAGHMLQITDLHRSAADMIHADEMEHVWIRSTKIGVERACPFCGVKTAVAAPKCSNCHEVIDEALYAQVKSRVAASARPVETLKQPAPPPPASVQPGDTLKQPAPPQGLDKK